MTVGIAVVIPVLGDEAEVAQLLPLLRLQQPEEIVVVSGRADVPQPCAASTRARIWRSRRTAALNSTRARERRARPCSGFCTRMRHPSPMRCS
jgi:hypothetical protein